MKLLPAVLALTLFATAAFADDAVNLLSNPNFAEWTGEKPDGWAVPSGQNVSQITDAEADGVTTALKVEVTEDGGESLGEIRQSVKTSGGRYRFEGMFESTQPGLAIFMIKLLNGKTEQKRLTPKDKSGSQWTLATLEFDAGDATEIRVLCRYDRSSKAVGGSGSFTRLKLVAID